MGEMTKNYFVHPSTYLEKNVKIGENTQIWHFCHLMEGARIGRNCKIGQNVFIDRQVQIGNGVKIENNVSVYKKVTIEDDVFLGPSCVLTNVFNPRSPYPRKIEEYKETKICKGATIGANATIVCGNNIGKYAFVGAGAVVTKDVPDYALVVGNPARQIGWMCACGVKIVFENKKGYCPNCHRKYIIRQGKVKKS